MTTDLTFDICFTANDGAWRVAKTVRSEAEARAFCRDLSNFPPTTVHFAIHCDDGRTIHDTRHPL